MPEFDPTILNSLEWYDNSRLSMILRCDWKGFYNLVGPPGSGGPLANRVGQGADFGTCFHAADAMYAKGWGRLDQNTRRRNAIRAFAAEWEVLFANGPDDSKHSEENGIDILDHYFDTYAVEDRVLKPVDPELGFVVRIEARPEEPSFKPFYYVGRTDGVFERTTYGDWLLNETKTSGASAERRIKSLRINRQPVGYYHIFRDLLGYEKIKCVMVNVILIAAKKRECARDYFTITDAMSQSWRAQTIRAVEQWRSKIDGFKEGQRLLELGEWRGPGRPEDLFIRDTEECFSYGQCPYYDLCAYGISPTTLSDFSLSTWNPLAKAKPTEVIATNDVQVERMFPTARRY